jgi:hypothetical protein
MIMLQVSAIIAIIRQNRYKNMQRKVNIGCEKILSLTITAMLVCMCTVIDNIGECCVINTYLLPCNSVVKFPITCQDVLKILQYLNNWILK